MIKLIITIYYSKRDQSGNCYWAFTARDTQTGKTCEGTISGGESNITASFRHIVGDDNTNQVHYTVVPLGKRDFKRQTGSYPYAGCPPQKIATFIKGALGWAYPIDQFKVVAVSPDPRASKLQPKFIYHLVTDPFRPEDQKIFRCGAGLHYRGRELRRGGVRLESPGQG